MVDPSLSAAPSTGLTVLGLAITAALVPALPAARWLAGSRGGEAPEATRAATIRVSVGVLAWLGLTGTLAAAGVLDHFDRFPPPIMPLFLAAFVLVFAVAFSKLGRRLADDLPLSLLVGYQGFRVAVEIMLHQAASEGVIGVQMSWSGLNFDVVTGLTGLALGLWLWRREDPSEPRALLWAWNIIGLALLLTIVTIALMSVPGPLDRFEGPANVWVATLPFVWLPMTMVTAALLGHLLLFRRLLRSG